ncbi:DNA-3-methyladenine glycosylase [Streptomyces sp. MS06]|uniref:DNA-3-methyladenine glycosylase n=1 Tax=Streptomyces sp. MS06 TaxID=3385974 RepID=UPI0039A2D62A
MPETEDLLPRPFFARAAHEVAPDLLGHVLISDAGGDTVALRITEVEAYEGGEDPASHGWRGQTPRNNSMFGPPGHLYVYWIYGMHHAANLVCGAEGESHAVLVRAGEVIAGTATAAERRPAARSPRDLARGPGRLADALAITRDLDGSDLCDPGSAVRVARGRPVTPDRVLSGPRTGVSRAQDVPWRFWTATDPTVSPFRRHTARRRGRPTQQAQDKREG